MSDYQDQNDTDVEDRSRRRIPDPINLVVGLGTLLVSAYVLSDGAFDLPAVDPRWLIAGAALLIGLLLLAASLRPSRRR
jgi:hypothetical protein